ncbi:MAG: hypothetical protein JSU67_05720 [Gammaproteobacteria bacterium]|nr:MAG: hypothetical protein JSU67_05720 [Gammaproteobacteria bacterium]
MTAQDDDKERDVMLAADVGSYSITTVNLAVQMAASMNARLRGLFIEDEDLLQMTGLPITREISLTTARERPTDVDQMQRAMRSVARQFEEALKQEAGALRIGWSFDYVRGRLRDLGLKHGADVTYIILGQPVSHRLRSRSERAPRKILLVANQSVHQKRALDVVLERFRHENVELTLAVDNADSELAHGVAQIQGEGKRRIVLNELKREQLFDQLPQLGSSFDCAIISRHEKPEDLRRILKTLSCPVILVA